RESIHPASGHLASESKHIECESAEHDLHCFQAIRRMDEILINNFMVFDDVMREGDYDLVIGDEAWEGDSYLHDNPRQNPTPCDSPEEPGALRVADGLRRLAPDARRRRARGLPHRRLQPGDDRTHRAASARPRPCDLRRESRRHRSENLRTRASLDPRLDGEELLVLRVCHRL